MIGRVLLFGSHSLLSLPAWVHLSIASAAFTSPTNNLPTSVLEQDLLMPSGKSPLDKFPELLSRPSHAPWSADIIDGHNTLKAAHEAVSRVLNLDESDPIRLRHYEKQIKTVMLSTLQALAAYGNPPLPEHYINDAANSIRQLAGLVAAALNSSLKRYERWKWIYPAEP